MRTPSPFAAPPKRKAKKVKVESPEGRAEMNYVRARDNGCVARLIRLPGSGVPLSVVSKCEGRIEVDHVRASGGLGMKSRVRWTRHEVADRADEPRLALPLSSSLENRLGEDLAPPLDRLLGARGG